MTDPPLTPPRIARVAVPAALVVGAAYLTWRLVWTRSGTDLWLFWLLWAAEATLFIGLLRMTFEMATLRSDPRRPVRNPPSVDVAVIARDEPVEVLLATLRGCSALHGPHRTVLVDTMSRTDLGPLALTCGVEVLRADHADGRLAPEVHLNAVTDRLASPFVAVLRGDDVPLPGILEELLGDFDDPDVWLAQGLQAEYGISAGDYPGSADELGLFFGVVQPGKNHHRAAYWCGSGSILRRAALDELGGVPTDTDTPTFQLSLAANDSGWVATYHATPVVLTLTRPDVEAFVARHSLWAAGNLQSLRTSRSPLWARGLSAAQRMSYLGTMLTYLGGPRRLAILVVLATTLMTGSLPVVADPLVLVPVWGLWMGCLVLARGVLARGHGGGPGGSRGDWLLVGAQVSAWVGLLLPRSIIGSLRSPAPTAGHRHRRPHLRIRLLAAATMIVALAAIARVLAVLGLLELPAMSTAATTLALAGVVAILGIVGSILGTALRRQRRTAPRFTVETTAVVGGVEAPLLDVSERGASVRLARPPLVGCPYVVGLFIPGLDGTVHRATVAAEVRSVRPSLLPETGHVVGLSFTHLSATAAERLAEYCRVLLPARTAAAAPIDAPEPVPARGKRGGHGAGSATSGPGARVTG